SFDVGNRLADVKEYNSQGGTLLKEVKFGYDALGNRIEKDVDGDGNGTFESITKFAYDSNGNAWADLDNSGNLTTRRLYTNAVDALFARIGASGNEDWYLDDALGSIRDIVNSSGTLIDRLEYSSFGKVTNETSSSNGDRYKFTGREFDSETGLQYNVGRYYIVDIASW